MRDLTRVPSTALVALSTALIVMAAACEGSSAARPSPTAPARSAPTSTATAPAPPLEAPPSEATPTPSPSVPPLTATPSKTVTPSPPPASVPPAVPPGRREELAPIEQVEVISTGGGTATARITSGLPSGCAVYSRAAVTRIPELVRVEVYNHFPTGAVVCTAIYGYVTNDVPLGGGFALGVLYHLEVNGTRQPFTLR